MTSGVLFQKASSSDTAQLLGALLKMLLGLYAGPTAVALGVLLERLVLKGVESWDPGEAAPPKDRSLDDDARPPEPPHLGIGEVLSFFGIKSIEIEPTSLLQLMESQEWSSATGGVSAVRPERPIALSAWFDPVHFPAALSNATIQLDDSGDERILRIRCPSAGRDQEVLTARPDSLSPVLKSIKSRVAPQEIVTIGVSYLADTASHLLGHGIRLSGAQPFAGFEVAILCEETSGTKRQHLHLLLDAYRQPL